MTKELLRKTLRQKRNQLADKEAKAHLITEHILSSDVFQKASVVMLYRSAKGEVDTEELWHKCLELGKTCVFPKCVSKTKMIAVRAEKESDFAPSAYGIMEPISNEAYPKDQIDLILVPGLGFDRTKNRIGYGAGYYDRYLKSYQGTGLGLCYNTTLVDDVYGEPHDIPLSYIATESGIF